MTIYSLIKDLYLVLSGDYSSKFNSKYEVLIGILGIVEDYEASEHTGKDPKTIDMNLFINGDNRYYTFNGDIQSGDFLEGKIKINGIIPGGSYKSFVIDNEMATILTGNNYSCQAVSLRKEDNKWIAK